MRKGITSTFFYDTHYEIEMEGAEVEFVFQLLERSDLRSNIIVHKPRTHT